MKASVLQGSAFFMVQLSDLYLTTGKNHSFDYMDLYGDSPGKNTGVGCYALLQGVFPTQGLNPGLPLCRWVLYRLSPREALGTPVDCISISFNVSANLSWKSLCLDMAPLVSRESGGPHPQACLDSPPFSLLHQGIKVVLRARQAWFCP